MFKYCLHLKRSLLIPILGVLLGLCLFSMTYAFDIIASSAQDKNPVTPSLADVWRWDTKGDDTILVGLEDRNSVDFGNGTRVVITQNDARVGTGILESLQYGSFYVDGDLILKKAQTLNPACTGEKVSYFYQGKLYSPFWGYFDIQNGSYYCPKGRNGKILLSSDVIKDIEINTSENALVVDGVQDVMGLDNSISSSDLFDDRRVAISGMALTKTGSSFDSEYSDNNTFVQLDNNISAQVADLNAITDRNIALLTAGFPKESGESLNNFSDQGVMYYNYEGTEASVSSNLGNKGKILSLGNGSILTVKGDKTLIVEGGNLLIKSDIKNADTNSILVIVVKRDKTNKINGGNVYIDPNVTNIDAVIISEGSILSYGGNEVLNAQDNTNDLRKQLLIYGAIASRNTIGNSKVPYGSDGYIQDENKLSKDYDLGYLRSFQAILNRDVVGDCEQGVDRIVAKGNSSTGAIQEAFAGKKACYLNDSTKGGLRSTEKLAPLVIEYNSLIQTNPPAILQTY